LGELSSYVKMEVATELSFCLVTHLIWVYRSIDNKKKMFWSIST